MDEACQYSEQSGRCVDVTYGPTKNHRSIASVDVVDDHRHPSNPAQSSSDVVRVAKVASELIVAEDHHDHSLSVQEVPDSSHFDRNQKGKGFTHKETAASTEETAASTEETAAPTHEETAACTCKETTASSGEEDQGSAPEETEGCAQEKDPLNAAKNDIRIDTIWGTGCRLQAFEKESVGLLCRAQGRPRSPWTRWA